MEKGKDTDMAHDCIVKGCLSTEAKQHHIYNEKENLTFVTRVCDTCKSELTGKQVNLKYYRCGRLIFVEEIDNTE